MAFYSYITLCCSLLFLFIHANTQPASRAAACHLTNIQPIIGRQFINFQPTVGRHLKSLVPSVAPALTYHNGTLLTGDSRSPLLVHLLWYGSFTSSQRSIVTDFLHSFDRPMGADHVAPSVWSWWKVASSYVDNKNASVANRVTLGHEFSDLRYSMGKALKRIHMRTLLQKAIKSNSLPFPNPSTNNFYVVLTAVDVYVERFCMNSCGFHDHYTLPTQNGKSSVQLPLAWVGNSATQCPSLCAWPFAIPTIGPPSSPLLPPNRDVGMDGMIINIATLLAGVATNPFGNGYFQGDASTPLEVATMCAGSFGRGSYPGYPGKLLIDNHTKTSFNAWGINQREYLVPALWDPSTSTCSTPFSLS